MKQASVLVGWWTFTTQIRDTAPDKHKLMGVSVQHLVLWTLLQQTLAEQPSSAQAHIQTRCISCFMEASVLPYVFWPKAPLTTHNHEKRLAQYMLVIKVKVLHSMLLEKDAKQSDCKQHFLGSEYPCSNKGWAVGLFSTVCIQMLSVSSWQPPPIPYPLLRSCYLRM